jgi:hypothetical protein
VRITVEYDGDVDAGARALLALLVPAAPNPDLASRTDEVTAGDSAV